MEQKNELPLKLARPAQRALANAGITSLEQLSKCSESEVSGLHGIGPNAIIEIKKAFSDHRLTFSKK